MSWSRTPWLDDSHQLTPEIDAEWLLQPVLADKRGMLIVIQGSMGNRRDDQGWCSGDHERAKGVVLSVLNTGHADIVSSARVRLLNPADTSVTSFTVPVKYLWPVEPDEPGQNALILDGDGRGEVAKIREEDPAGWYVSVGRSQYLVVPPNKMVQMLEVDIQGNLLGPA